MSVTKPIYVPDKDTEVWAAAERRAKAAGTSLSAFVIDSLRENTASADPTRQPFEVTDGSTTVRGLITTKGSITSPLGQALVIDIHVDGPGALQQDAVVEIFDGKTGEIRLRIKP